MKNNILKKSFTILLIILFVICIVSCVNAQDDNADSEIKMLTLSKGGIVMNYPSTWGYSQSTSQYSIMAISGEQCTICAKM